MEAAAFSEGMNGVSNAPVSQTLMYSSTEASPLPVCSGASAKLFQCCPMGADFKGQGTGVNLGEPLGMTPGMQWSNVQSLNASHFDIRALHNPVFPFPTDPAFVERAVKFSTFGSIQHNVPPIPLNPSLSVPVPEIVNRVPEPVKSQDSGPGKKRKNKAEFAKSEVEESKGKRRKSVESDATEVNDENQTVSDTVLKKEKNSRPVPQKEDNYIHVRARRGQATDSHSLAERLRREKINERMKYLQELVPTCHKVTGKAVMLDEIINYVQSLQNQVAILSMKLATVNPTFSYNLESYMAKEECMPNKGAPIPYFQMEQQMKQSIPSPGSDMPSAMSSVESAEFFDPSNNMQKHGWESDLHNIYNDLHSLCDMEFIQGTLHRQ